MKKTALIFIGLLLIVMVVFFPPSNKAWLNRLFASVKNTELQTSKNHSPQKKNNVAVQSKPTLQLSSQQIKGQPYFKLNELVEPLGMQFKLDVKNGTCQLRFGSSVYRFVQDIAVLDKNGNYSPMKAPMVLNQKNEVLLPMSIVGDLVGEQATVFNGNKATIQVRHKVNPTEAPKRVAKMDAQKMIKYLSFLNVPISGARVSTKNSSLPGAARTYRKGVHEGIDWYGGATTGVAVNRNTPVYSIADGVVVRVDHNFKEWSTLIRESWLIKGKKNNGQTPHYILDKLRGRSVWVQYEKGVMARFVHLDRIPKSLKVGQKIKAGKILGYVGNSGTSDGAKGNDKGIHLHMDLLIYGDWFWKHYTPTERRQILEKVFDPKKKPAL